MTPPTAKPAPPGVGETTMHAALPVVDHGTRSRGLTVPKLEPGQYLAIEDGGEVVVLPIDQDVTHIGRAFSAQVRLEAPTVSRRHAMVVREAEGIFVCDDRSQNGVFVNEERIERRLLVDGDRITVGAISLTFLSR